MKKRILIVDDERDIVDLLVYNLEREGYETLSASDGKAALTLVKNNKPDLLLLDLMLPELDGLEVCRLIRKDPATERLPIIMLTAKAETFDRVVGLEIGADDYVTKPFHIRELLARVKAMLRRMDARSEAPSGGKLLARELEVDFHSCEVKIAGRKVDVGAKEFKLLKFLAGRPGRVYSRGQLLDEVWGDEAFVEERTVDVHISRLRAAIEPNRDKPQYILTVRGLGYKFADPGEEI